MEAGCLRIIRSPFANPPISPPPPAPASAAAPAHGATSRWDWGLSNRATCRDLDLRERRLAATGSSSGRGGTNESDTALDATRTPLPPVPPTGCPGPDPFAGIPGLMGVCVNGGWVPIGHPLARRAP